MAQFKVGKASVTQGQQAVTFENASLVGNGSVSAGNLFSIVGENVWYQIESVAVVDGLLTQVVLATPYAGESKTDRNFAIHRSFSTNLGLPLTEYGDSGSGELLGLSMGTLDSTLAVLGGLSGPLNGSVSPIFTLRKGVLDELLTDAGISIHREGLDPIILHYTAGATWQRWSLGDTDLGTNGRIGIGREPAGSEKLAVAGNAKIDGDLEVVGDLKVSGETLTLDVENLSIEDAVVTFASGNSSATAPYIGMKAERGGSDAFFVWDESVDRWSAYTSSDDLVARTLATIQAASFVGALTGNASTATTLATARTLSVSGDATGSISFNGSANVAIPLTLANTGVGAGTFTRVTVDAKGRVTAGTALVSLDVTTALGFTPYYSANAAVANVGDRLVLRDASGNFAAGAITATSVTATQFNGDLLGTAQTAGKLFTARTITISTDASGSVSFDGSANVTLGLTLANSGVTAGTYSNITVDAKGRVTSARAINSADVTTGLGYTPLSNAGGTVDGNLTVTGNLLVQGTLTQQNTTVIEVDDPIMTIGKGNTAASATYLGLKAERGGSDAFFVFEESTDRWSAYTSSDDLTARTLGSIQAATFIGALTGNASTATTLATARTINGVSFNGSANISFTTDAVAEGATNKYYTDARARAAISVGSGLSYNSTTGVITISAAAAVTSVAGRGGDVVLATADITGLDTALANRALLTGATFTGEVLVRQSGSFGYVLLQSGNSTAPGTVNFLTADAVRRGYLGWKATGDSILLRAENGWGIEIQGATVFTSTPKVNANDIWHAGNLTPSNYVLKSGSTMTGLLQVNVADSALGLLVAGATKGVRIVPGASGSAIEGVDNTGVGSYQPLTVKATTLTLDATSILANGSITIQNADPQLLMRDTNHTAGKQTFKVANSSGTWYLQSVNDANSAWIRDHIAVSHDGGVTLKGNAGNIVLDGTAYTSGDLTIGAKSWPQLMLNKSASGQGAVLSGMTNGLLRWQTRLGSDHAETGSNAGSNFDILRFNDAGAYIDIPFSIARSTGAATFSVRPSWAGAIPWDSGNLPNPITVQNFTTFFTMRKVGYGQIGPTGDSNWVNSAAAPAGTFMISMLIQFDPKYYYAYYATLQWAWNGTWYTMQG